MDIGESDPCKQLLVTFNKEVGVIDFIESAVYFVTSGHMYVKQWRIDANQKIIVTWLKLNSSTPISVFVDFKAINAQRIDIYYEIDSSGKFHETKYVKYKLRIYTEAYLLDKTKNLWQGNEVPVN